MGEQSEQLAGGAQGGGRVPRAEDMAAPAPVRTSQMEFEAMTRRAGQGYGGYAPHAPLLAEARLELCRTLGFDEVPPGTAVCTEGEPGHCFYVVLYGTLEVSQKRGEGSLVREV